MCELTNQRGLGILEALKRHKLMQMEISKICQRVNKSYSVIYTNYYRIVFPFILAPCVL